MIVCVAHAHRTDRLRHRRAFVIDGEAAIARERIELRTPRKILGLRRRHLSRQGGGGHNDKNNDPREPFSHRRFSECPLTVPYRTTTEHIRSSAGRATPSHRRTAAAA